MGSPDDGTVQDTAVLKAVGKPADIHAAPVPKAADSHLHFLVALYEDFRPVKRIDILFALSEINILCTVCFDKMIVLVPVVLIYIQGEPCLFLHAHHSRKLEEMSLILVRSRFSDSDKPAAVVDESLHSSDDLLVCPVIPACISGIRVAHVQDHVDVVQDIRILPDIVKTDELHVERRAAQRLNDPCVGVVLFVVDRVVHHMVPPCAHLAPAVEDCDFFDAVRSRAFDIVIQCPELIAYTLNIVDEFRELHRKLQVTAVSDPVDGLPEDRPSRCHPVDFRFFHRIPALMECIREEIRKEAPLCISDSFDIADQPESRSVSNAPDDCVQTDALELIHERLHADPVVAQEHHCLFAALMRNVYHFLRQLRDLSSLECLEITEFL